MTSAVGGKAAGGPGLSGFGEKSAAELTEWRGLNALPPVGAVDVWTLRLDDSPCGVRACVALLSADELARARRFWFERHASRFVVARAALRSILASYLGTSAAALRFAYCPYGKPRLGGDQDGAGLEFNLSHTDNVAAVAVSQGPVGVDIEVNRPVEDAALIARHAFSLRERAELDGYDAYDAGARSAAFLRGWTRKEAYVKARGDGLSMGLDSFSIPLATARGDEPLSVWGAEPAGAPWAVYHLDAGASVVGAVAAIGARAAITVRPWA